MYPASDVMEDMIPKKTIEGVSNLFGTTISIAFNADPMNPVRSAIPIPIIPTNTIPNGAKLIKFSTILEIAQKTPSLVRILFASKVRPVSTHFTFELSPLCSFNTE